MELFLLILELIGTVAFAIGGSILAIKNKMDILGVIILSIIAALGGGLIRDVVINSDAIVLFTQPIYLATAVITALIIFIIFYSSKKIEFLDNEHFKFCLNIIDGIGLGVFVVIGANAAFSITDNMLLILFSSLITGVGGGMIRDLLVNRIPNIFRKHIYAVAALIGLIVYVGFSYIDLSMIGALLCIIIVTLIRILSHHLKLSLPKINIGE